jgi:microcystin-dependent protein
MPYLTPEAEGGTVYRLLAIPSGFLSQVDGAIGELANYWNWEQFGAMTPLQCAAAMFSMWEDFVMGSMLIGMVVPYVGVTIPNNVLVCDGSVYNRVDYPYLYAVLAAAYKDTADTFHVPNLVDSFVMGDSENSETSGGEATHTLTIDEIPSHNHPIHGPSTFPYGTIPEVTVDGSVIASSTGDTGGGEAHNNLPPFVAMMYVIIAR